jgi:hypothetical protein|tara:strand:+ start:363 stop:581 length:219 start_codon:yes stop_codon:yes gene_type:complete
MIEYKLGKDEAPTEDRYVVFFNANGGAEIELIWDDDIKYITENNLLWGYIDMPWEIDGFVMPEYLDKTFGAE